jgi:lipopolysaccharide export system permease protein
VRLVSNYIRSQFLVTFAVTLLVFTFVMCMMILFRVTDIIAVGAPPGLILKIFFGGLPSALSFAIPMSVLTAALLSFGRLSANGEIVAMKSSGLSMWQIARPPIIIAALLSCVSLYLVADLMPTSYHARRKALRSLGLETPLQLLEEGRCIREFPGFTFYFRTRDRGVLKDVIVYQHPDGGPERNIRARSAVVTLDRPRKVMVIDLRDVRVDPVQAGRPGPGFFSQLQLEMDVRPIMGEESAVKKRSDLTLRELLAQIRGADAAYPEMSPEQRASHASVLRVELHKRLALAAASLSFVFLGVPLATRTHRRESSIGIAISLGLVVVFYLFIVVAETLAKTPALHPHWIAWVPIALSLGLGTLLIRRVE